MSQNLNVKDETIKLLEKNRENLQDLGLSKEFMHLTLKVSCTRGKSDILDVIKVKNIYSVKDTVQKTNMQATRWEKIFSKHILTKTWYLERTKNSQNSTVK